jgi:hypothetical protein
MSVFVVTRYSAPCAVLVARIPAAIARLQKLNPMMVSPKSVAFAAVLSRERSRF